GADIVMESITLRMWFGAAMGIVVGVKVISTVAILVARIARHSNPNHGLAMAGAAFPRVHRLFSIVPQRNTSFSITGATKRASYVAGDLESADPNERDERLALP